MTRSASPLASVALALGVAAVVTLVGGVIWASTVEGEAGLAALYALAWSTAIVSLIGTVVGAVAVYRRAQPRWRAVVGISLSALPLLLALTVLGAFLDFASRAGRY